MANRNPNKNYKKTKKSVRSVSQNKRIQSIKKEYVSKLVFRDIEERNPDLWKKVFLGLSGFILLMTIVLSIGSGINGDDYFQNDYSDGVLNFYQTMGKDTSFFSNPRGPIKIYGGLFEVTAAVANKTLGNTVTDNAYHDVRHVLNALFGFLAMFFTGLMARKIGGWRAGVIALTFIFLSPRFLGHSMMNPKDIPFAAGYIMAIYFMLPFIQQLPKPNWKIILGLIGGIAIGFGIRASGVLLIAYLGLFAGLAYLLKYGIPAIYSEPKLLLQSVGYSLVAVFGGLLIGTLFWPYGLLDPLSHTQEAMGSFSKFAYGIRMLFNSEMIMGTAAPAIYLPTWMLKTIPLFSLTGILLFAIFAKNIFKRHTPFFLFIAIFTFLFPVLYVIGKSSTLYDGWRHLMFAYPPMVVIAALAWNEVLHQFQENKAVFYGALAVLGITVIEPMSFIAQNSHYPYVYFNPIAGGMNGAFGQYETDYWGVSVKQGLDWLEEEGIIGDNMTDTIMIVSNFSDALNKYANGNYNGKVKSGYVRFRQRYDQDWDYALFASRFVPSSYLKGGKWPPDSKTIHTVTANGIPLMAVLKNEDDIAYRGIQAAKKQDWSTAIALLTQEVAKYPDNEVAYTELARAYLQSGQLEQAGIAANKALEIEPENLQSMNLLALYYLRTNQVSQAQQTLNRSLEFEPRNSVGYYYLAIIDQNKKDLSAALNNALKSIEVNNKFREGYQLVAKIYEQMGDTANAQRYAQAAQTLAGGK